MIASIWPSLEEQSTQPAGVWLSSTPSPIGRRGFEGAAACATGCAKRCAEVMSCSPRAAAAALPQPAWGWQVGGPEVPSAPLPLSPPPVPAEVTPSALPPLTGPVLRVAPLPGAAPSSSLASAQRVFVVQVTLLVYYGLRALCKEDPRHLQN